MLPRMPSKNPPGTVFVCCSPQDRKWSDELQTMLQPLERDGVLRMCDSTRIAPGTPRLDAIRSALESAQVAVLLVSPKFLESDLITEHQLPALLNATRGRGLILLWVLVSACLYEESEIATFQEAHDRTRPLDSLNNAQRRKAWVSICNKIKDAIKASRLAPTIKEIPVNNCLKLIGQGDGQESHAQQLVRTRLPSLLAKCAIDPVPVLLRAGAGSLTGYCRGSNPLDQWTYVCDRLANSGHGGSIRVLAIVDHLQSMTFADELSRWAAEYIEALFNELKGGGGGERDVLEALPRAE